MAICGYNHQIGAGLQTLVEGMITALEQKARKDIVTNVLDRELIELDNMIAVMRNGSAETLPSMFVGLNLMARALFEQVRANLRVSGGEDLAGECRRVGDAFVKLLAETEERHVEQRAKRVEAPAAEMAAELAEWVVKECSSKERNPVAPPTAPVLA
jgi:hypothetical protein